MPRKTKRLGADAADTRGRWNEPLALDLVGLARRAGRLAVGTHAVKDAARQGELHAAVLAGDATDNARERVLPLLVACGVPVVECDSAAVLGRAVGRPRTVVVGLKDAGLAGRVLASSSSPGGRRKRD